MKGRKPDAAAAKRGTARQRKSVELAPPEHQSVVSAATSATLPPPRQIPRTKAVKALWTMLLREVAVHELREGDLPLLEALCVAKVRHSAAGMMIRRDGMMVDTPFGPVKHPMLKVEHDEAVLYDRLAQRLGLSPESRVRLNLMQVAGATLLGSLKKTIDDAVDADLADVVDAEATEVD